MFKGGPASAPAAKRYVRWQEMKVLVRSALAYAAFNLILFSAALEAGRRGLFKGLTMVNTISAAFMFSPLIYYFVVLFVHTKRSISQGGHSDKVIGNGFKFAVLMVAALFLPMVVNRVGPDGPIEFSSIEDFIGYLVSAIAGCILIGGFLGLFGMIMVNQFFGDALKNSNAVPPNKAL